MKFGLYSIFLRWLLVASIVFATYNPSGRSFFHWAPEADVDFSLKLAVGLVLLTANLTLLNLALRSLGYIGTFLVVISTISIAVTLERLDLVRLETRDSLVLYIILFLTLALTLGVCWSAIRTRISGQVDSDDISKRL